MTMILGVVFLLLGLALGLPIAFGLAMSGVASLSQILPVDAIVALIGKLLHETSTNYVLLTIPMFVAMAEFLAAGGVAEDLLIACNRVLRKVKGGMAMACILAGAIHAAATGSSTASAASLSRASFPAMMKAGYAPSFAVGTIAIAGTLAIMIPPSIAFVIYGLMTQTSIGKLFVAGVFPGLLTTLGYLVTISLVLRLKPELGPDPAMEARFAAERGNGRIWPVVLLIVIILGGLYSGVATPTEIAAVGALAALVISAGTGRMSRQEFTHAVGGTLRITSMIILIIAGAHLYGDFISFSKFTEHLLKLVTDSGLSPTLVMLIVVAIYLILGMIMDQSAIIILTAPITTPLMVGLGYDAVWWGVIIVKTAEIGLVTPPVGLVTFVVSSTTKTPLPASFRGVFPFVITELVLLGILLAFPQISLFFVQ